VTQSQRNLISHAIIVAENAYGELGSKAANGAQSRPTVQQLNRTLERLQSIGKTLEAAL
jgi:hypothetical protein